MKIRAGILGQADVEAKADQLGDVGRTLRLCGPAALCDRYEAMWMRFG
ncbi:MAG: hypothetical protein JWQ81_7443 [Amycolatopsis sp.]|jgi:hypothetical protein|nr:hypothetical protein [Amycolatopsis sp.]MCU1686704.1 hypothetical protein [Amycolatopsis sp.]